MGFLAKTTHPQIGCCPKEWLANVGDLPCSSLESPWPSKNGVITQNGVMDPSLPWVRRRLQVVGRELPFFCASSFGQREKHPGASQDGRSKSNGHGSKFCTLSEHPNPTTKIKPKMEWDSIGFALQPNCPHARGQQVPG